MRERNRADIKRRCTYRRYSTDFKALLEGKRHVFFSKRPCNGVTNLVQKRPSGYSDRSNYGLKDSEKMDSLSFGAIRKAQGESGKAVSGSVIQVA